MTIEIYLNGKAVARIRLRQIPGHWCANDMHAEAFKCALEDGTVQQTDFDKCEFGIMPDIS